MLMTTIQNCFQHAKFSNIDSEITEDGKGPEDDIRLADLCFQVPFEDFAQVDENVEKVNMLESTTEKDIVERIKISEEKKKAKKMNPNYQGRSTSSLKLDTH